MHSIKRAFFWLSGAGTETLEQCPAWEQRKYVAFGATVLVPCAFAFIACAYALSTLTDNARVIYPVAAVWAFIILTIDRALLAGYRAYMSVFRKLSQFSLRLVVAMLMGITIAHPLVLLLFRDTISSVIEKDRAAEIEVVRAGFQAEKEKVRGQVTALETALAEQRAKWNESFQARFILQETEDAKSAIPGLTSEQQTELKAAIDEATAPFRERLAVIEKQSAEFTPQYAKLQTELGFWQAEFERELNGQRSGMRGEGPRARSIRADQLEPRREESKRLGGLLEHLTAEKATLQTQSRQAEAAAIQLRNQTRRNRRKPTKPKPSASPGSNTKSRRTRPSQFVTQQNALRETIKQQIDTRLAELNRVQGELAAVATEEAERLAAIRAEPRRDILTQTLALHALFKAGNQGGQFAFYTYIVLTLLFMLVDTIPLIVKFFTKPGPLRHARGPRRNHLRHRAPRLPPEPQPLHGPARRRQPHRRHPQPAPGKRPRRWRRTLPRRPRVSRFTDRDGKILRRENEARGADASAWRRATNAPPSKPSRSASTTISTTAWRSFSPRATREVAINWIALI